MAVVAGLWLWRIQRICAVPSGDRSFRAVQDGIAGLGAGASAGCARQRADQSGEGNFPVTAGAVSSRVAVNTSESWKAMKAPPRDALTVSAVTASAAPTRVSRTVLAGNAGTRVVTLDRGSSIAFDAREHKFVNAANAPAASAKSGERAGTELTGVAGGEAAARVGGSAAQNVGSARVSVAPAAARAATPPAAARAMKIGRA